ncbi:MAG: ATP-dependent helicase, partial [Actinomycetota bacterium]|nr:ATP-dependent helicase [Actinomycetota bacterium]
RGGARPGSGDDRTERAPRSQPRERVRTREARSATDPMPEISAAGPEASGQTAPAEGGARRRRRRGGRGQATGSGDTAVAEAAQTEA